MDLTVNGEPVQVAEVTTVGALLDHFHVSHQAVAVITNGTIVARDAFEHYTIQAGDSVEIIRFVGGG